jgi:hypothetical protein|tara:strand:+ start:2463 stop:2732 length:270 start_codon:yes stop_codon:yes gene_type:complete
MGKFYKTFQEIKDNKIPVSEVVATIKRRTELIENFDNHDCHTSEMDGCKVCGDMEDLQHEKAELQSKGYCVNKNRTCKEDGCTCWEDEK